MTSANPFLEFNCSTEQTEIFSEEISNEIIAEQLLKKKYILTALEFYAENQERGNNLLQLQYYFSELSHFETQTNFDESNNSLFRTGSCSTFDSLDLTRFSEDDQRVNERIAVLEFELRKANDTIKILRGNLTEKEECLCGKKTTTYRHTKNSTQQEGDNLDTINAVELKAINYLVNEYLLKYNFKLSSIAFSDENSEQDFDDWHDVGINTSKPPDLLRLYRNYYSCKMLQTQSEHLTVKTDVELDKEMINNTNSENERLSLQVSHLKKENDELHNEVVNLKRKSESSLEAINTLKHTNKSTLLKGTNIDSFKVQSNSVSNVVIDKVTYANQSGEHLFSPNEQYVSPIFWELLLAATSVPVKNTCSETEVWNISETPQGLVMLLAKFLPNIIPNVLLPKRHQLIPLILSAAALHHDQSVRIELIHFLFNLIKKPDEIERQKIILGCVEYARCIGETRTEEEILPQCWEQIGHKYPERRLLITETCGAIAPYVGAEMRCSLLVCILQQIDQQEKVDSVRCSVVKSLAIIDAFDQNFEKYNQSYLKLKSLLQDSSKEVVKVSIEVYLPVIALWSVRENCLHLHLMDSLLSDLETFVMNPDEHVSDYKDLYQSHTLRCLLSFLFSAILLKLDDAALDLKDDECGDSLHSTHVVANSLEHPCVIIGNQKRFSRLLLLFDSIVLNENFNQYQVLSWTVNILIPRLLKICQSAKPTDCTVKLLSDVMEYFERIFGEAFFKAQVIQTFRSFLEEDRVHLSSCVLPVYTVSMLSKSNYSSSTVAEFLIESIVYLSNSCLSLNAMLFTLNALRCNQNYHHTIVQVLWETVLHESPAVRIASAKLCIVMTSSEVKNEIFSDRILPALITLATDDDIDVKVATIPALASVADNQITTTDSLDRVILQMTEILSANSYGFKECSCDGTILGIHSIQMVLLTAAKRSGPIVHPKYRDEFLLPHLLVIATINNHQADRALRLEIADALLKAFTSLSCCSIQTNLLQGYVLPALNCLKSDMEAVQPESCNYVFTLIRDSEQQIENGSILSGVSTDSINSRPTVKPRIFNTST